MGKTLGRGTTGLCVVALTILAAGPALAHPSTAATPWAEHGKRAAAVKVAKLPAHIDGGAWEAGHVQGIAIDKKNKHMYFSYTDTLVKTDLDGNVIGTVSGFTGHLGDLAYNPKDGRVYGSLEYKEQESFYIAIFDVEEITEVGMDAEASGIVSAVYLEEVVADYTADMDGNGTFDGNVADTPDHRYGSSGIDGVSFGPEFGKGHGKQLLSVAYGIYENNERTNNDYQVILQYDTTRWRHYERPLTQDDPHTSGPSSVEGKYFVYTGNTRYGVQNLEYDAHTGNWFLGVYRGSKEQFPNNSLYIVDGDAQVQVQPLQGMEGEEGKVLPLVQGGLLHEESGVYGWEFTADVGIESLDNGYFYVVEQGDVVENGIDKETADAYLYRWTGEVPTPFEPARK